MKNITKDNLRIIKESNVYRISYRIEIKKGNKWMKDIIGGCYDNDYAIYYSLKDVKKRYKYLLQGTKIEVINYEESY